MPKHILAAAALAVLASAVTIPAYALPSIPSGSEINVTGAALFNSSAINFTNPADIPVGGTTGGFAALGSCTGCVTMNTPFVYSPFTPGLLYTASHNGATATFTAQTNTLTDKIDATDLIIHDTGLFSMTGFADTKGTMSLTVQQGVLTGSFSSTGLSSGGGGGGVPEPASLMLLGAGLVGLGVTKLRLTKRVS